MMNENDYETVLKILSKADKDDLNYFKGALDAMATKRRVEDEQNKGSEVRE